MYQDFFLQTSPKMLNEFLWVVNQLYVSNIRDDIQEFKPIIRISSVLKCNTRSLVE